jgi:uracil-DNA glycosylase family 4
MMVAPFSDIREANREIRVLVGAAGLVADCLCGGSVTSPIAFVAEAPGEREVQTKQPLIGNSGRLLWDVMRKDGITRNHVYITNVVKRKLVSAAEAHALTDKQNKIVLSKQELTAWRHILREELSRLPNLQYVVVFGNYALEALTGNSGILKYRGSVLDTVIDGRPIKVLCTFNPAYIIREPRMEIVFRMDCGKLKKLIEGTLHAPEIICHINPSANVALDFIRDLQTSTTYISHDIETMADETACVGLAASDHEGMCINWRREGSNAYSPTEERAIRLALQELLSNNSIALVAQNGHFDATWMWYKDRIRVHGYWFDTMLAHHTLYPALPHNLGFITAQYTDYPYYKDERETWKDAGDIDGFWRYNVHDCCITRIAAKNMLAELKEQDLYGFFFNHVMRLQRHLIGMTINGVKCDTGRKDTISRELEVSLGEARRLCESTARVATGIVDYTFNPRSHHDLRRLFFTDLKLVGRGDSTDKENRDRMRRHPKTGEASRRVIEAIDSYARDAKFASTYAAARTDDDGRFRCEYRQTGVASAPGRLSSSQTAWGTGLNLQNIPDRAKDMFVAPDGYEFSYFDMSQIEARIVAYLAHIPEWKEQFENARLHPGTYDAHCALASTMFKVPYGDVPKYDRDAGGEPTIRFVAKRCRHGLNYRMAPDKLATVTGLSIREAERAYRLYHAAAPQITVWWDELAELVRRNRSITTCLGRRWILLERYDADALDAIVAFEPQSINGDHTSSVIYKCQEDDRWPSDARIVLNIHDALVCINRPSDGALVRAIMKEYAEQPIWINSVSNRLGGIDKPEPLIVPAEFGVSYPDEYGTHRWSTIRKVAAASRS